MIKFGKQSLSHTGKIVCSIPLIIALVISSYSNDVGGVSKAGLELIGTFESCIANSYYCPANKLTVGVGHTGKDIVAGKVYSNDEIAKIWAQDIKTAATCVSQSVKGDITQGQLDAYTAHVFNNGCSSFRQSSILSKQRAGDKLGSCKSILLYNKIKKLDSNGKPVYLNGKPVMVELKGLTARTQATYQLCIS